jgi:hypothetical protein
MNQGNNNPIDQEIKEARSELDTATKNTIEDTITDMYTHIITGDFDLESVLDIIDAGHNSIVQAAKLNDIDIRGDQFLGGALVLFSWMRDISKLINKMSLQEDEGPSMRSAVENINNEIQSKLLMVKLFAEQINLLADFQNTFGVKEIAEIIGEPIDAPIMSRFMVIYPSDTSEA